MNDQTQVQDERSTSGQSRSTDGLALNALCEAMFYAKRDYVKEHYCEPKMSVTFSPDGYLKSAACAEAQMRFSHPCANVQTVNGYPFLVERWQEEDFVIHVANAKVSERPAPDQ